MRPVVTLALAVLRRPAGWMAFAGLLVGGCLLLFLPLFGQPGLELGLGVSALLTVAGTVLGIAAADQARVPPRPTVPRVEPPGPIGAVSNAIGAAFLLGLAGATVAFAGAVGSTLLGTPCSPWAQAGLYPLLVVPTALVAAATGVFCRTVFPRWPGTVALAVLLFGAAGAWTLWPIATGPQVYAYNFFLGWFPGPLYDEALRIGTPLLWFRLETVLWAGVLGLWAMLLFVAPGRSSAGVRRRVLPLLGLTLLAIGLLELRAVDLGLRASEMHLQETLGGHSETAHAELYFPAEKPAEEVERLRRDVEFRWEQVSQFLGGAPAEKVRLYVFRTPAEKGRLIGASHTQVTKRLALYLNDAPFPLPVLEHEMAHALASRYGTGPFGTTARFGFVPLMGVVEGVATAPEETHGGLPLHAWAAAMRRQKLMPDVRDLLRPAGFYLSSPERAYTATGSFIRWLRETYGAPKLQALLAHADFQGVYGQPLDALAADWERMLDGLQLDERVVNRAFARFRAGSVFSRRCAREVAALSAQERAETDPLKALELIRRCAQLQPDEPSFVLAEAALLAKVGRVPEATAALGRLQSRVEGLPALEVEVGLARVRLAYQTGDFPEWATQLEPLVPLRPGLDLERQVTLWRAAQRAGEAGRAVMAYLARPDEVRTLGLMRAVRASPDQPLLHYLLGRRFLLDEGAPAAAAVHLRQALALGLPPPVDQEAWRLRVSADFRAGDCGGVADDIGQMPDFGPGLRAEVTEWQARCAFDVRTFHGPLVPADPFR